MAGYISVINDFDKFFIIRNELLNRILLFKFISIITVGWLFQNQWFGALEVVVFKLCL